MSGAWRDDDIVARVDQMPSELVHAYYDRVYRVRAEQRQEARRDARRAAWRSRLHAIAVVLMFVLLLALAGGIERTGW